MTKKGEKQLVRGNDTYDLLISLIFSLSPVQAKKLYAELLPKYTNRGRVKLYNAEGEEDKEGKIRLMPLQYKSMRTSYGDTFIKRAFTELTNYINYLEKHIDENNNKTKLNRLSRGTHNMILASKDGWVYNKCKQYIIAERPKVAINPYLIDDFETALEYICTVPKELWEESLDVQSLLKKFPELINAER